MGVGTYETLEGELADEELGRLLVATNFTESDRTGPVPVRLLDTTGRGGGLASGLGGELLTGGLASGGLAGSLLSGASSATLSTTEGPISKIRCVLTLVRAIAIQ